MHSNFLSETLEQNSELVEAFAKFPDVEITSNSPNRWANLSARNKAVEGMSWLDESEEGDGHGIPTVALTGAKQKYHRRQRK